MTTTEKTTEELVPGDKIVGGVADREVDHHLELTDVSRVYAPEGYVLLTFKGLGTIAAVQHRSFTVEAPEFKPEPGLYLSDHVLYRVSEDSDQLEMRSSDLKSQMAWMRARTNRQELADMVSDGAARKLDL